MAHRTDNTYNVPNCTSIWTARHRGLTIVTMYQIAVAPEQHGTEDRQYLQCTKLQQHLNNTAQRTDNTYNVPNCSSTWTTRHRGLTILTMYQTAAAPEQHGTEDWQYLQCTKLQQHLNNTAQRTDNTYNVPNCSSTWTTRHRGQTILTMYQTAAAPEQHGTEDWQYLQHTKLQQHLNNTAQRTDNTYNVPNCSSTWTTWHRGLTILTMYQIAAAPEQHGIEDWQYLQCTKLQQHLNNTAQRTDNTYNVPNCSSTWTTRHRGLTILTMYQIAAAPEQQGTEDWQYLQHTKLQ